VANFAELKFIVADYVGKGISQVINIAA